MKTKLIIVSFAAAIVFGGCSKDGEIGPQGAQGPTGPTGPQSSAFTEGGFIKGTVTGTRRDGVPFSFDFNDKYYDFPDYFSLYAPTNNYYFYLERYPVSNSSQNGKIAVSFSLSSLSSTSPLNPSLQMNHFVDMGNNNELWFYINGAMSFVFTSFSYDSLSHVLNANFTGTDNVGYNSTYNPVSITGSVQTTMKRYYFRKE
jgi:hypothetical protein